MMLAHRFATKHGVIGERFLDLDGVEFEALGNFRDHFIAHATELILRVHHHGDESAALDRVSVLQFVESRRELSRHLHQRSTSPRTMSIVPMQATTSEMIWP